MSKILMVEAEPYALSGLASALRQQHFQLKTQRDLLDGLRELAWFSAKIMVWAPHPKDPARLAKYRKIKQYRKYMPLFIIDDETTLYNDPADTTTFVYSTQAEPAGIVQKIIDIIGLPTAALQYEDDEEHEAVEENS